MNMDFTIQNGWILGVLYLLLSYILMILNKQGTKRLVNFKWIEKSGKIISFILSVIYRLIILLPVFSKISTREAIQNSGIAMHIIGTAGLIALYIMLQHPVILEEEKFCLDTYGEPIVNTKIKP